jgi:hypothetical protein
LTYKGWRNAVDWCSTVWADMAVPAVTVGTTTGFDPIPAKLLGQRRSLLQRLQVQWCAADGCGSAKDASRLLRAALQKGSGLTDLTLVYEHHLANSVLKVRSRLHTLLHCQVSTLHVPVSHVWKHPGRLR